MKGQGSYTGMNVNGEQIVDQASVGSYTVYASPNFVIGGNGEVTKHYYSGSQRVMSQLGGVYTDYEEKFPIWDAVNHLNDLSGGIHQADIEYGLDPTGPVTNLVMDAEVLVDCSVQGNCLAAKYYFHSDHLGSSSFITDDAGEPYQFISYLPFGETMLEQRAGTYDTPYKYTGKELDELTGLYYYGARYYDPMIGNFMSVDPLADKFVEWSPYHYATNNPINIIDYDGRDTVPANSGLTPYLINKPEPFTPIDIVRQGNDGTTKAGAIFTAAGILTTPEDIAKLIQSQKGVFFDMSSANGSLQLTGNETNDDIAKMLQKIGGKNLTLSNTASVLDGVGKSLFYVGAAFSAAEGVYNFNEGNYVDAAGNVLDIFFGAVGTWGGLPGAIISTLYFGPKIYYNNGGKERGEALGSEMMRKQEEGNLYHPKLNKSRQMKNPKK